MARLRRVRLGVHPRQVVKRLGLLVPPAALLGPLDEGHALCPQLLGQLPGRDLPLVGLKLPGHRGGDGAVHPGPLASGLQALGHLGELRQLDRVREGDTPGIEVGPDLLRQVEEGEPPADVRLAVADKAGEAALGVAELLDETPVRLRLFTGGGALFGMGSIR
jgi:hypothetical protein